MCSSMATLTRYGWTRSTPARSGNSRAERATAPPYGRVCVQTRRASRASYTRPTPSSSSHGPMERRLMARSADAAASPGCLDGRLELLPPPEAGVEPPAGEQLRVGPFFDQAPVVED